MSIEGRNFFRETFSPDQISQIVRNRNAIRHLLTFFKSGKLPDEPSNDDPTPLPKFERPGLITIGDRSLVVRNVDQQRLGAIILAHVVFEQWDQEQEVLPWTTLPSGSLYSHESLIFMFTSAISTRENLENLVRAVSPQPSEKHI